MNYCSSNRSQFDILYDNSLTRNIVNTNQNLMFVSHWSYNINNGLSIGEMQRPHKYGKIFRKILFKTLTYNIRCSKNSVETPVLTGTTNNISSAD